MTQPQMYPPQGYPPAQYPQPQYPAQQPPQQPAYQPGPQFQQPAYGQPQQFPMAQGYPPVQMAPPAAPLAQGSIEDFFNQPSTGGGKSLAFTNPGDEYTFIVSRPLGAGDVQQQTAQGTNAPQFFKDGRPKFVMKVPVQMQPSAAYPDGVATWFVKGQARDELVRAMAEAGAPAGPPEAYSRIRVVYTGTRPSGAGMNPAKLVAVTYWRPDGAAPAAAPQPFPAQPPAAPVQQQQFQAAAQPDPQLTAYAQAVQPELAAMQAAQQAQFAHQGIQVPPGQYAQAAGPVQHAQPPQPPVQQPPAPAPMAAPDDMSPEQQALLAKLTGATTG